ncbi:V-type proton ATPase subunit G-like [Montipora capricornis]|uniref:V-type proton ATPase subunit G-like n=1 Tax=Montipora capricornis TaxID=246305 RepID=UPI0035F218ED
MCIPRCTYITHQKEPSPTHVLLTLLLLTPPSTKSSHNHMTWSHSIFKMASQSQGIQQLLQAEKKAETMVSDARKRKTQKLKRAKEEAQAEIRSYKEERERQFKEYQREHMGSKDDFKAKVDEQTMVQLNEIGESVEKNKEKVIDRLLNLVYDIKPELHQNLRT